MKEVEIMKEKNNYSFRQVFWAMLLSIMAAFVLLPTNVRAEETVNEEISEADLQTTGIVLPVPQNLTVTVEDCLTHVQFDVPESEYQGDMYYRIQCAKNGDWENGDYSYALYDTEEYFWLDIGEEYYFRVRIELDYYNSETGEYESFMSDWSEVVKQTIAYDPVVLKSVQSAGVEKIKLTWETSYDGEGYRIYRSTSKDSGYSLVKTITDPYTTTWTNTGRTPGTVYYYKVCTYDSTLTKKNGQFSVVKSTYSRPLKKTLTAKSAGIRAIQLTWKNAEDAVSGYEIYRATEENGTFKLIKTITSKDTLSFKNTNLTFAKYYYYKIRAYTVVNDQKVYGLFCAVKNARAMVPAPTMKNITLAGITKAKLTWEKVPYASGYQIYRATASNGTYKRIKTITGNKTFTHTAGSLVNGNTYYFKIRAYRTVNGKTYYGEYSPVKKRLMNKVGYEYESYYEKAKRIWGTDYYKEYATASAASKNMKTIKIKTWDINSKGQKYTRYHYLTVHKNIAETVQQIFKEIYNGKEKFPIKDVGGYSWRGASSSSEHCEGLAIDINYNENAQFSGDTGKPLVGSLYKPGKNPYSIPADGDVVNAFRKYGFSWGYWFYNPDYMHFSYFGR